MADDKKSTKSALESISLQVSRATRGGAVCPLPIDAGFRDRKFIKMLKAHRHSKGCFGFEHEELLSPDSGGLTNHLMWVIGRCVLRLYDFVGVFPDDEIPAYGELEEDARRRRPEEEDGGGWSILANLSPSWISEGHYVAVIKVPEGEGGGAVFFIDSLGSGPRKRSGIERLLTEAAADGNRIFVWTKKTQPESSKLCGFFAMTAVAQFDERFKDDLQTLSSLLPLSDDVAENPDVVAHNLITFMRKAKNDAVL